ncbi:hypothetical protein KP79_PYT22809 [Mizuhopecten yessoensis]|uniref:Uncharacterized protein n=1 Tax=Mizuhopecten yessoensis TaxID=6573 RepID=A0A210Q6S3_MIZYE|nr:hypothetical protein KP79_PYT22809 [Mizuhopecten yessoensis]
MSHCISLHNFFFFQKTMDCIKTIKLTLNAMVSIHTKFEKGLIPKSELTNQVLEINMQMNQELNKFGSSFDDMIKQKDNKIKELVKYNSQMSTKITKLKRQNEDLKKQVEQLNTSQDTLSELLGMDDPLWTSTPKKARTDLAAANSPAPSTSACSEGTYPLMGLLGHDRVSECCPDACHTIKDVTLNIVSLISGKVNNKSNITAAEKNYGRFLDFDCDINLEETGAKTKSKKRKVSSLRKDTA